MRISPSFSECYAQPVLPADGGSRIQVSHPETTAGTDPHFIVALEEDKMFQKLYWQACVLFVDVWKRTERHPHHPSAVLFPILSFPVSGKLFNEHLLTCLYRHGYNQLPISPPILMSSAHAVVH